MKEIGISYPIGLGDGIAMAGGVEYLTQKYDRVYIPCHTSQVASIEAIHEGNERVVVCPIGDIHLEEASNKRRLSDNIPSYLLGNYPILNCLDHIDLSVLMIPNWYHSIGLDYSVRWTYNPIPKLQKKYAFPYVGTEPYIFVHDDERRGFGIDIRLFPPGYRVIRPQGHDNILEYIPLILGASQIHFTDSSFLHLIRQMVNIHAPIFFHEYARPGSFRRQRDEKLDAVIGKGWGVYEQDPLACIRGEPDCLLELLMVADDGEELASATVRKDEYFKPHREGRELGNIKAIQMKNREIQKRNFLVEMIHVKREGQVIRRTSIPSIPIPDMEHMNIVMPIRNMWI